MRTAYITIDEVNQDLARRWAEALGAILQVLTPAEGFPDTCYDAVLVDLDSLPADYRQQMLRDLLSEPADRPVAVHSYSLTDEEIQDLKNHGVAVTRRLERRVIRRAMKAFQRISVKSELQRANAS